MFTRKSPETSWSFGVKISVVRHSPSWPVTGGIVPMPHRLPKEQTAAIVGSAGSVESVEKVLLGMQDMFGKPSFVKGQAVRVGLLAD